MQISSCAHSAVIVEGQTDFRPWPPGTKEIFRNLLRLQALRPSAIARNNLGNRSG
jgi:hypothetical protein